MKGFEAIKGHQEEDNLRAVFLFLKSRWLFEKMELKEAEEAGLASLELATQLNDTASRIPTKIVLGLILQQQHRYEEALVHYQGAYKLAEMLGREVFQANCAVNMAIIYSFKNQPKRALFYLKDAERLFYRQNELAQLGNVAMNIGTLYEFSNHIDTATTYFEKALAYSRESGSKYTEGVTLMALLRLAIREQNWPKAIVMGHQAMAILKQSGNKYKYSLVHLRIAEAQAYMGRYDSALYYIDKSDQLTADHPEFGFRSLSALCRVHVDTLQGDFRSALKHYMLMHEYDKATADSLNKKDIEELTIAYETEKKDRKNEELTYENSLLAKQQKVDKYIKYSLSGVVISLLLVGGFVVTTSRQRRHQLVQKQRILELEKEQERERFREQETLLQAKNEATEAQNKFLQLEVESERRQAIDKALQLADRQKKLKYVSNKLEEVRDNPLEKSKQKELEELSVYLGQELQGNDSWQTIMVHFNSQLPTFFQNLENMAPQLSKAEERLCAYIRLKLSNQEVARLDNITIKSVFKKRQRLKEKLNLESSQQLEEVIADIRGGNRKPKAEVEQADIVQV